MKLSDLTDKHIEWLKDMVATYGSSICIHEELGCPEKCKLCPLSTVKGDNYPIIAKNSSRCFEGEGFTAHQQAKLVLRMFEVYLVESILLEVNEFK